MKHGGFNVERSKKITVWIPGNLLREMDCLVSGGSLSRSEIVTEAMRMYIIRRRRHEKRNLLRDGYREMSVLNSTLSEEGLVLDNTQLSSYEESLQELGKLWWSNEERSSMQT